MRHSPSNRPHTRKGPIYRTIFLLLPTVLLAVLSQSGCGLALTSAGVAVTPSITTQPTNQTVAVGQTATFFVTTSGAAPLSYQWEKNGTAISGATSPSYTTLSETTSDSGAQFTVVVSNSAGSATSNAATLTVNAGPGAPLQIATSPLSNAQVGIQFQASLTATGGAPPYQWGIASGTLPSGLSLNAASGMLSGTPSQGGQFDFSVQVSDSSSPTPQTTMKALILSVLTFALQITPGSLPNGQVGVPFQTTIAGNGGVTPYTWAITGALPSGLSLNASSGTIAGTPTQAGTSAFTIVLTDSTGQTAQKSSSITIAAAGPPASGKIAPWSDVAVTSDANGYHYYTFSFPGYAKYQVGDGISSPGVLSCYPAGSSRELDSCQGVMRYWDLKNDPAAQWDFGADDTGMFEHQWHIQNAGAVNRVGEMKEGPMTTTVTESNNVRVVINQTGHVFPYGSKQYSADCCITMTKTYVFYRYGGAGGSGTGASKVYTQTTLNYDGTDGLGPLSVINASMVNKMSWYKVSGEQIASTNTNSGCGGALAAFTPSPWNLIYQAPGGYTNKDYNLFSVAAANSSTIGEFIPGLGTCVSPSGSFTGPEGIGGQPSPGTVYNCNGASNSGCTSQSLSSAVVKANFLQIEQDQKCDYNTPSIATYFYGGLRYFCNLHGTPVTLNTNTPVSWKSAGFIGDNGIVSESAAAPYVTEYKTPPTMTVTNGTGGAFDSANGYWTVARTSDNVSVSSNGLLQSPAFLVSNWTAVSTTLVVGGVTKLQNTDFVDVKTDGTHLLVQYLSDVPASTTIAFTPSSAPTVPALQITPGGLPSGQVGTPFQAVLTASGGVTPYTWAVTGALPVGLSLGASSGAIAGTPAQASISAFTIVLTDSTGQTAQEAISITIAAAGTGSGQVVITPSAPPAVNQGTTFQFTVNATGTWSCSGTDSSGAAAPCKGSINASTGLYTAPATVTAQRAYGGFQLHPNNHIYNTRIDSLPVHPNSATWLGAIGGGNPNYSYDFPVNYVTPSTPTQNMGFLYTPGNNGSYEVPEFPDAEIESGWFSARARQGADHHMQMIDTVTGQFEEFYQYYTLGLNGTCPTCGSQSGIKYLNTSYDLPAGGSTDAAGLELMPLELGIQEMEQATTIGGTINHALRVTFGQGNECSCKLWPATTFANDGGFLPFGARARLKASFDISPYSPIAKILMTQLKQYGIINADGGNNWPISVQHGRWPKAYVSAFQEVGRANLASNMEFADESSLMVSPTSGLTTGNREIVTFTRASDSAKASVDVVLQGVAVNLPQDVLYIQAGTPAQQFTAFANIGGVTWSMSPSVGTLTSTGLYTAPAAVGSPTTTIVTATSVANSSVAASMTITIFPTGSIRVMPSSNADYVDSSGNTWTSRTGVSNIEDDLGCCNFDPSFPNITDSQLWSYRMYRFNDIHMDFRVPAGTYQITYRVDTFSVVVKLGAQGQILADNVDLLAAAGGDHKPYTFTATVTVGSDNKLSFVIWDTPTGNYGTVSSLQITPQ